MSPPNTRPLFLFIEILVNMALNHWCKTMVTIIFEYMNKTLTQVVEDLEDPKILDITDKKSENKKSSSKDKPENETKTKCHKCNKNQEYYIEEEKDQLTQIPPLIVTVAPVNQRGYVTSTR